MGTRAVEGRRVDLLGGSSRPGRLTWFVCVSCAVGGLVSLVVGVSLACCFVLLEVGPAIYLRS